MNFGIILRQEETVSQRYQKNDGIGEIIIMQSMEPLGRPIVDTEDSYSM